MGSWKRIASKSELPAEYEVREFTLGDKVVCIANIGGEYSALDNVCGHRGGPLGQGVILEGKVVCPWHGWMYDPKTGVPDVDPRFPVAVYRLRIEGDDVLVEL
jgi:nitrite reductase (NADH) small subunit